MYAKNSNYRLRADIIALIICYDKLNAIFVMHVLVLLYLMHLFTNIIHSLIF